LALSENALTGAPVTSFSSDGVLTFGGSGDERVVTMAALGTSLYATRFSYSSGAGIDGGSGFAPQGSKDAFILALNALDGTPITTFSSDGIQSFGGSSDEDGNGIAVFGQYAWVSGYSGSADAKVGGAGPSYDASSFGGFLLSLKRATGESTQPPQIQSQPTANPNPSFLAP